MINSIALITVSPVLGTNWTSTTFNNKNLGYVVTNHVAEVVYQGQTNQLTLKTDASDKAVWSDKIHFSVGGDYRWGNVITLTNISVFSGEK